MTLYWHETGPLIYYAGSTMGIEDLNPETKMRWHMSRWEMFMLGLRCLVASLRG